MKPDVFLVAFGCSPSRAFSVPIGIGTGLQIVVLTRFLYANRLPLRWKTLREVRQPGCKRAEYKRKKDWNTLRLTTK
jgi:hypothetical protein